MMSAAGNDAGSTPALGRNGDTGGRNPLSPGIIGMPLGIGMGMSIPSWVC